MSPDLMIQTEGLHRVFKGRGEAVADRSLGALARFR